MGCIVASYNDGNVGGSGINANCTARTLRIELWGSYSYRFTVRSIT